MIRKMIKAVGLVLLMAVGLVIGVVGLALADGERGVPPITAYVGKDGWCLDVNREDRKGHVWIRHPFDGRNVDGQLFVDIIMYLEVRKKEGLEIVLAPEVGGYWMYKKKGWKSKCQ